MADAKTGWFGQAGASTLDIKQSPEQLTLAPSELTDEALQDAINSKDVKRARVILAARGGMAWDEAWKLGFSPWDAGQIQPSLEEGINLIQADLPKEGIALVPGCGRGYDPVYLATVLGYEAIGLEISSKALEEANKYLETVTLPQNVKVEFVASDFFAEDTFPAGKQFDVIMDHTFFIAIPPSYRQRWGERMAALVKQNGYLITLVFPIDGPRTDGPPFSIEVANYVEVLGDQWEKVVDKVPEKSSETHEGRERLVIWKRK